MFAEVEKRIMNALEEKRQELLYGIVGAVDGSDYPYAKSLADRRAALTDAMLVVAKEFKKVREEED
jgi:hypothetical protein